MRTYERNGVHVDQCSDCRGIFLDRGELERLVDAEAAWSGGRSAAPASQPPPRDQPREQHREQPREQPREQSYGDSYGSHGYQRKKRKESFFEDLFG